MTTAITTIDRNAALAGPDTLEAVLEDSRAFEIVASSFPGNMDPQRRHNKAVGLVREAIVHIANSEARDAICRCSNASILDTLASCARLDLSLTKALGHAYLVPFKGVCTLMVGFKGFVKLIVEAGYIRHLETVVVYQEDEFQAWRDTDGPHFRHVPNPESQGDEKKLRLVYLVARTSAGEAMFEMMNRAEIDKVRKASKQANGIPWQLWYTEMSRKSVIRRFEKVIPKGMESPAAKRLAEAIELDNRQYDPRKLAEYAAAAAEHSRTLQAQATAPLTGEAPPEQIVTRAQCEGFRVGLAKRRAQAGSSMSDAEFTEAVILSELGEDVPSLESMTSAQYKQLTAALKAGKYDWATGEKLPEQS